MEEIGYHIEMNMGICHWISQPISVRWASRNRFGRPLSGLPETVTGIRIRSAESYVRQSEKKKGFLQSMSCAGTGQLI